MAVRSRVLAGYLVASAGIVVLFLVGRGRVPGLAVAASTLLPLVGVPLSLRRWTQDRRFGIAVAAGFALLSAEHIRRVVLGMPHSTNGDGVSNVLIGSTFVCLLGGAAMIVKRHAPSDPGGIIDAVAVGIAGAVPAWEFLQRPSLQSRGASATEQLVLLVVVFVLFARLGAIGRVSATAVRARFSLRALYLTQATSVVGFVVAGVTTDRATNTRAGWITLVWIVCYLSLGAVFVHPSSHRLSVPEGYREPTLSYRKLAGLGAVIVLLPLVGIAPQAVGRPADSVLIAVGTLVAVPLVLLRIGQLIALRAADQRALAQLAAHDDLTGLPNRRTMMALLARALSEGDVTVLYCDLDGFKPVNDAFGHHAGDEVLRVVARRLQHCLRAGDTVGRLGGDEFLVICRGLAPEDATALQRRIHQVVTEPVAWQWHHLTAGVTIGLATASPGVATDALVAEADQNMYAGKRARTHAVTPAP